MQMLDYLKKRGLSKYKAAKELEIQWTTLWRWTTGRSTPTPQMMQKVNEWSGGKVTPNDWLITPKTAVAAKKGRA